MDILSQIEELKSRLGAQPASERMTEEFKVKNTFNSNAIEGGGVTLRETSLILSEDITLSERSMKEQFDIKGHKGALDFIAELCEDNSALTESDVLQLHAFVLMYDRNNAGVYRKNPVSIAGSEHNPPQPYLLPRLMEELVLNYANSKEDIFDKIAKFHLDFENIHPFSDGNGRTGRLIINLELMKNGYLPVDIKFSDRERYFEACHDYDLTGSVEKMKSIITEYELEALSAAVQTQNSDVQ